MNSGNSTKAADAFTKLVETDRQKKKHETLAQKMLGSRRSSAPGPGALPTRMSRPAVRPLTLASRAGVVKRSNSTTPISRTTARSNIDTEWKHDRHHLSNRAEPKNIGRQLEPRKSYAQVEQDPPVKVRGAAANNGTSLSIKGIAGPYTVTATNFAPGTTAADIESAMQDCGEITECFLINTHPTVQASITYSDRSGAQKAVDIYNGSKADGRTLTVVSKPGGPAQRPVVTAPAPPTPREPTPPREDEAMMEIDTPVDNVAPTGPRNNNPRYPPRDDRLERRDYEPRGRQGYDGYAPRDGSDYRVNRYPTPSRGAYSTTYRPPPSRYQR